MPGFLLHVGAKVTCFDGGPADPAKPNTNVKVSGQPTVLLQRQMRFAVVAVVDAASATAGFAAVMVWMYWTSLSILVGAQIGRSARDVLVEDRRRPMLEGDL